MGSSLGGSDTGSGLMAAFSGFRLLHAQERSRTSRFEAASAGTVCLPGAAAVDSGDTGDGCSCKGAPPHISCCSCTAKAMHPGCIPCHDLAVLAKSAAQYLLQCRKCRHTSKQSAGLSAKPSSAMGLCERPRRYSGTEGHPEPAAHSNRHASLKETHCYASPTELLCRWQLSRDCGPIPAVLCVQALCPGRDGSPAIAFTAPESSWLMRRAVAGRSPSGSEARSLSATSRSCTTAS